MTTYHVSLQTFSGNRPPTSTDRIISQSERRSRGPAAAIARREKERLVSTTIPSGRVVRVVGDAGRDVAEEVL